MMRGMLTGCTVVVAIVAFLLLVLMGWAPYPFPVGLAFRP